MRESSHRNANHPRLRGAGFGMALAVLCAAVGAPPCAGSSGEARVYRVHNPLSWPVRAEPVTISLDRKPEGPVALVDQKTGQTLPSQVDATGDGGHELVSQVTLPANASRRVALRRVDNRRAPEKSPRIEMIERDDRARYALRNGRIRFRARVRGPRRGDRYHLSFDQFEHVGVDAPAGVDSIGAAQQAYFTQPPDITVQQGPVRARLIAQGPGSFPSQKPKIEGTVRLVISIYADRATIDTHSTFTPKSNGRVRISGAGTLSIDQAAGDWRMTSPDHETGEPFEVTFGAAEGDQNHHGERWVAGRGKASALAYAYDDRHSRFARERGEGGALLSKVRIRVWNFPEQRGNYISPHGRGIRLVKGQPITFGLRLTVYPQSKPDATFARQHYEQFVTEFLAERRVENPSAFEGDVALRDDDRKRIRKLIRDKDVALVVGEAVTEANLAAARSLAKQWQTPLMTERGLHRVFFNWQYPRSAFEDLVLVLLGCPATNRTIALNNDAHGFVDAYYPGDEKGRITVVDAFLDTPHTAIFAGGNDKTGARRATAYLAETFAPPTIDGPQWRTLSPMRRVRPWMRRGRSDLELDLAACRGETATGHVMLYAPRRLSEIDVNVTFDGERVEGARADVAHTPWSFPGIARDGKSYPQAIHPVHPDGHPLPQRDRWIEHLKTEPESTPFVCVAPNHDAIWPGGPDVALARQQVSFWVKVRVPADMAAGTHRGQLEVTWAGGSQRIALTLNVRDVTLPPRWAMGLNAMYSHRGYRRNVLLLYLGIGDDEQRRYEAALRQLGGLLWSHGATVANVMTTSMRTDIGLDGDWSLNMQPVARQIEAYEAGGFEGRFEFGGHPTEWRPVFKVMSQMLNVEPAEARRQWNARFKTWLKSRDLQARSFMRVGDEPNDFEKWAEHARRAQAMGLRTTVCHVGDVSELRRMRGAIDMWCPNWFVFLDRYSRDRPADDERLFNEQFMNQAKRRGEAVWNYTYGSGAPYSDLRRMPTELRFYFWDSFAKGADGVAYYGAGNWSHHWSGDEYDDRGTVRLRDGYVYDVFSNARWPKGWHGGLSLMYPDARTHRVLSSQRWEVVREAQEDVRLFALLRKRHGDDALRELLEPVVGFRPSPDQRITRWWQNIKASRMQAVRERVIAKLTGGDD